MNTLRRVQTSEGRLRGSALLEFAAFAPQGGRVDAEDAGGFFGGGGSRQHAFDVFALDLLDGKIAADLEAGRGNRRMNPFGKGRRLHDLSGPENGDALDDVAQLSNVPGQA